MQNTAPIIVLGAGHNGLTAAAYLAKQGRQVLVLERREFGGGISATEPLIPGYQFNTGFANTAGIQPDIVKDLGLESRGFEPLRPRTAWTAAGPEGPIAVDAGGRILFGADRLDDPADAERLPALVEKLAGYGEVITDLMRLTPPNVKATLGLAKVLPWAGLGLDVRRRGGRAMTDLLRILPSSAREFLDENLSNRSLKAGLAAIASLGAFLGPFGAGSTLNLLFTCAGGLCPVFARGGAGSLSEALRRAVVDAGGEVRFSTGVSEILVENGRAAGVLTESGERIEAAGVVSSLNPRTTFRDLLAPGILPVRFTRRLDRIRFKGSTATLHFALDHIPNFGPDPDFLDGWITVCPSIEYLERAYDDAKYGRASTQPALLAAIPSILDPGLAETGRHTLTAVVRYVPYGLPAGDLEALTDRVMDALAGAAPDFRSTVLDHRMIGPADYEREYGLAEGGWMHGQMGLDQLLIMRPVPGWSDYRTPVGGLWLCGSGSHPGGGITGAPGRNAAREILKAG